MTTVCRSTAFVLLAVGGAAGSARATDGPLLVAVDVAPGVDVAPADVRQAVASELGTPVVGVREPTAAAASDVLLIGVDTHELRMSLRAGAAPALSRTITIPSDRSGRLRSIGWLAGNLVRDQVGPIVGGSAIRRRRWQKHRLRNQRRWPRRSRRATRRGRMPCSLPIRRALDGRQNRRPGRLRLAAVRPSSHSGIRRRPPPFGVGRITSTFSTRRRATAGCWGRRWRSGPPACPGTTWVPPHSLGRDGKGVDCFSKGRSASASRPSMGVLSSEPP